MKQKIVIRVTSGRAQMMNFAASFGGVISVIAENENGLVATNVGKIIIIGNDIPVNPLMVQLCRMGSAELVSVTPEEFMPPSPPVQVKNCPKDTEKTTISLLSDILEHLKQGSAGGYLMEENEKLKARVAELEKYSELRTRVERLEKLLQ